MQLQKLPDSLNIKYEANKRSDFKGIFSPGALNKLESFVNRILDYVYVEFSCKYDILGYPILDGKATVKVELICMRCYEPYETFLETKFTITPVKDLWDVSDELEHYIALEINEHGEVNVKDAIEDELICSIPINPKEDEINCKYTDSIQFGEAGNNSTNNNKELNTKNPFSALIKSRN